MFRQRAWRALDRSPRREPWADRIYGLLSDVLLDWACAKIPFLKGKIPDGSGAPTPVVSR